MNLDNMDVEGYSSADAFIEDYIIKDYEYDTLSCWDESEIEKLILEGGYEDMDYDF